MLRDVGFESASIEPTRVYRAAGATAFLAGTGLDPDELASQIDGKFMGAIVRATKPGRSPNREPGIAASTSHDACCGPDCCN